MSGSSRFARWWSAALAVALAAASTSPAEARFIMGFVLDHLAWSATDVLVVTEGQRIDGRVVVTEVWRGDAQVGAELVFPDLADYEGAERRTIENGWNVLGRGRPGPRLRRAEVTGGRMVLFLVREGGTLSGDGGHVDTSAAWIEDGDAYALRQVMNPGGFVFVHVGSELDLRARVDELTRSRRAQRVALTLGDPAARVEALTPLLAEPAARESTFEALGACGAAAVPLLRTLLTEVRQPEIVHHAVLALRQAAGTEAAAELAALLDREATFWSAECPGLPESEWDDVGVDTARASALSGRYLLLDCALGVCSGLPDERLRVPLLRISGAWRTTAHPAGERIIRMCAALIDALDHGG